MTWACGSSQSRHPTWARVVRARYPDVELTVSMFGRRDGGPAGRDCGQALGATAVVLHDGRDLALIRGIAEHTDLEVELTRQPVVHAVLLSASPPRRRGHGRVHRALPLTGSTRCRCARRVAATRNTPSRGTSSPGLGCGPKTSDSTSPEAFSRLKVLDRFSTTQYMERVLRAYTSRHYEGNLVDLIPGFGRARFEHKSRVRDLVRKARAFLRPSLFDVTRARAFQQRRRPPAMEIRGDALDGFVEGLAERDCRVMACEDCRWCDGWAKKAIHFDERERAAYLKGRAGRISPRARTGLAVRPPLSYPSATFPQAMGGALPR